MISIREVVARIPDWKGRGIQINELSGGLTNHNYRVDVDGTSYIVRIPAAESEMLAINRRNEYQNSLIAGQSGVAPQVIYYLEPENVMVREFIQGRNVTINAMQNEEAIRKVAESVADP